VLAAYRQVLAVPGAPRLFSSAVFARLPQGMSALAVLLLVRGSTHSYAVAGTAVGAEALASAVCAPLLGRLIDRLGRSRVLMRCSVGYAVAQVALVGAAQLRGGGFALVALAFAVGALLPPIAPSVRALMRDVFAERSVRERAYALESVAQELIWIAGPLLVALVITFFTPAVAVLLIAAEGLLGTILFVRGPLVGDSGRAAAPGGRGTALSSGGLRALLVPIALTGTALGATEVGLPALALHAGSRSASGLLLALWSVGSMAGGLWYGSRSWRTALSARYATLLLAAVVCTAPLIVVRSLPAALLSSVLAGVTIAPVFSCQYALVGHAVSPGTETEAFTWASAALVGGIAAGSAVGGGLVSAAGVSTPFVLACGATGVAGAMAVAARWLRVRRAARAA
jgi:MFS family permease